MAFFEARPGTSDEWVRYNTDHIAAVKPFRKEANRATAWVELTFSTGRTVEVRVGNVDDTKVEEVLLKIFGKTELLG